MLAPLGTPESIIQKVNADLRTALEDQEVLAKFAQNGAFVRYMTPGDTTEFVRSEQKTWRPIMEKVSHDAQ
jgi:tripartite-type tricarboxylate transporter receptor subunit TctC